MTRRKAESFGETLARLRQARGLSQRALGLAAGLSSGAVSMMEATGGPNSRGKEPKLKTVLALAKALGVGPEEFFGNSAHRA